MDNMMQATIYLMSNSMSNNPNILPNYINMLSTENFIFMLENCKVHQEVMPIALNIKNEIANTNVINHQQVIDLFNQYNLDVDDGHHCIDLKKLMILVHTAQKMIIYYKFNF